MLAVVEVVREKREKKREVIDVLTDGYKLGNIWGSVGVKCA